MKKIFALFLALIMMLSLCACGANPEKNAKAALNSYLEILPEKSVNTDNPMDTTVDWAKYISEKYSHKLVSFTMVSDTEAKATVEISNRDLGTGFKTATSAFILYALGMAFSETPPSDEELNAYYENLLIEQFKAAPIVKNNITLSLNFTNDVWVVTGTESEIYNAVSGNLYNAIADFAKEMSAE